MVAGFSRSFSLPGVQVQVQKSYHTRSISLPCRSQPIISQLHDDIHSVRFWQQQSSKPESSASMFWICDGLSRLQILHASLNHLLNRDCRRLLRGSHVLDAFLRFADVYGRFMSVIMAMSSHLSDAQLALRSKDSVNLMSCNRLMRKAEKELAKLASSLQDLCNYKLITNGVDDQEEAEVAGVAKEVVSVTASASMALFMGMVAVSSTSRKSHQPFLIRRLSLMKRVEEGGGDDETSERLEIVEECVRRVEKESGRLFRCLVNTRVSLLNILSSYN